CVRGVSRRSSPRYGFAGGPYEGAEESNWVSWSNCSAVSAITRPAAEGRRFASFPPAPPKAPTEGTVPPPVSSGAGRECFRGPSTFATISGGARNHQESRAAATGPVFGEDLMHGLCSLQ